MKRFDVVALSLATVLATACSAGPQKADAQPTPAPAETTAQTAAAAQTGFTGKVVETMDAGRYTYVRVDTGSGDIWAATTKFAVKVGDNVHVPQAPPMVDFHSETLNRTFKRIYFVPAITPAGAEPAQAALPASHPEPAAPSMHTGAPVVGAEVSEAIAPASNGLTVAQVHAQRADLGGKKVTVRGKVVKANRGIMGTNWYHIQDGTGSAADTSHDLAVTSHDDAKVGDVVTITGTLAVDKDFGAGYRYDVIVEDATLAK